MQARACYQKNQMHVRKLLACRITQRSELRRVVQYCGEIVRISPYFDLLLEWPPL